MRGTKIRFDFELCFVVRTKDEGGYVSTDAFYPPNVFTQRAMSTWTWNGTGDVRGGTWAGTARPAVSVNELEQKKLGKAIDFSELQKVGQVFVIFNDALNAAGLQWNP